MPTTQLRIVLLALLLIGVLVACGGDEDESTPFPPATLPGGGRLEASREFTDNDVRLKAYYPDDWNADISTATNELYVYDDTSALIALTGADAQGYVALAQSLNGAGLSIGAAKRSDYEAMTTGNALFSSVAVLVANRRPGTGSENIIIGLNENFPVPGYDAGTRIPFTAGRNDGAAYVLIDGDTVVLVTAVGTDPAIADAIAASVRILND